MSDDVLKALAVLGADLCGEIIQGRSEIRLIEVVQLSINGIGEDLAVFRAAKDRARKAGENTRDEVRDVANSLAAIERILLKHATRLEALEKRVPKDPAF
jgi:hypothetical protein